MREKRHRVWGTITFSLLILALVILIGTGELDRWASLLPFENAHIYFYPLLVLFFTVIIARLMGIILHNYFARHTKHLKIVDQTRYALFGQLATLTIYLIGIAFAGSFIPSLRSLSVSLFASAGVLAIVLGFATQKTLGNLVSGMMIAIYQPYRINDRIKIGEEYGTVEDITLRHTVLKTWDNRRIIVPNSKMDDEVINNYTIKDERILDWFDIGISYDSDIDLARAIMLDEVRKHPSYLDARSSAEVLAEEEPTWVRVVDTAESSVNLRLYFWAQDQPTAWKMKTELRESIKKRFDKEGVEIPFPYHTIVYKHDLPKPRHTRASRSAALAKKRGKK